MLLMKTISGLTRMAPEVRADAQQPSRIAGYGAVYYRAGDAGTEYWLWDDVVERIMPGAFDQAIAENVDCRSCYNHDFNLLLGRSTAKTLTLSVDAVGLRYEVTPPAARADVIDLVNRRDVTGSSFMFQPTVTTWREEKLPTGATLFVREINSVGVNLYELGPVAWPAYEATTAEARSGVPNGAHSRFATWLTEHRKIAIAERDQWLAARSTVAARDRFLKTVAVELAQ